MKCKKPQVRIENWSCQVTRWCIFFSSRMRLKPSHPRNLLVFSLPTFVKKVRHIFQPGGFFQIFKKTWCRSFLQRFRQKCQTSWIWRMIPSKSCFFFWRESNLYLRLVGTSWCNICWKTQVLQGFHYLSPPHGILTPPKSTGCEEVTKRSRLEKTLHLHVDAGRQMFPWKKKHVSGMRQTCDPTNIIAVFFLAPQFKLHTALLLLICASYRLIV